MRRHTLIFTLLVVFLISVTAFAQSDVSHIACGSSAWFSFTEGTGTLVISGTGKVTSNKWSQYKNSITSVIVEDGITSLPENAFYYCSKLATVSLPDSVNSIGKAAFSHCNNLKNLSIPNGVTYIEDYMCYHCEKLTKVNLPNSVETIGESAFSSCTLLKDISLGNNVTSIEAYAFFRCLCLSNVQIPNVSYLGQSAFYGCESITSISFSPTLNRIEECTFEYCDKLKYIGIPRNVSYIGKYAFDKTYSAKSKSSPSIVYYGGTKAQWGSLTSAHGSLSALTDATIHYKSCLHTLDKHDQVDATCFENGTGTYWECHFCHQLFSDAAGKKSINAVPVIPSGHRWSEPMYTWDEKNWTVHAEHTCILVSTHFEEETVPVNVTLSSSKGKSSDTLIYTSSPFNTNGFSIQEKKIPVSVLRLPEDLEKVAEYSFAYSDCEAVIIPAGCQSIEPYAFMGCENLKYISIPAKTEIKNNNAFTGCPGNMIIKRP